MYAGELDEEVCDQLSSGKFRAKERQKGAEGNMLRHNGAGNSHLELYARSFSVFICSIRYADFHVDLQPWLHGCYQRFVEIDMLRKDSSATLNSKCASAKRRRA